MFQRDVVGSRDQQGTPAVSKARFWRPSFHGGESLHHSPPSERHGTPGEAMRVGTWRAIAGAAVLSVLMRLPMLRSPISVDEGGYLAIARAWAHGEVLYRDVFVDRPQGLLVLFRVWDWLSGGSTSSIRIMAMLFGVVLVVSTAVVVRVVAGHTAARLAGFLCAIVSAAPVLEGFAANTELLSGAVSAAGLALGVLALSKRRPLAWFFTSGVLAGVALSLKQTGFDGFVAVVGWLAITVVLSPALRIAALKAIGAVSAGLVTVMAVLMIHGALTGWARWWAAVAGYRLKTQSGFASAQWGNLEETTPYAIAVLGLAAVFAALAIEGTAGSVRRQSRTLQPTTVVLRFWLGSSVAAFLLGGGYWRHYWVLLAAPISALAGLGLTRLGRHRHAWLLIVATPCLLLTGWVYQAGRDQLPIRTASDHRSATDERVAKWFIAHRKPGQHMYALCSSAAVYADAHDDPHYPYLWIVEVIHAPHSRRLLVDYLSDPVRGPSIVAEFQSPRACDSSGQVQRILNDDFVRVASVGNVTMFERIVPQQTFPVSRSG